MVKLQRLRLASIERTPANAAVSDCPSQVVVPDGVTLINSAVASVCGGFDNSWPRRY
jgi:hypothetical protein